MPRYLNALGNRPYTPTWDDSAPDAGYAHLTPLTLPRDRPCPALHTYLLLLDHSGECLGAGPLRGEQPQPVMPRTSSWRSGASKADSLHVVADQETLSEAALPTYVSSTVRKTARRSSWQETAASCHGVWQPGHVRSYTRPLIPCYNALSCTRATKERSDA